MFKPVIICQWPKDNIFDKKNYKIRFEEIATHGDTDMQ